MGDGRETAVVIESGGTVRWGRLRIHALLDAQAESDRPQSQRVATETRQNATLD